MKFSVQSRTRALLSAAVTAALAASGAVAVSPALAATAAPAEAPLLQITEVAPDTANVGGSDAYEFIEVRNASDEPVDFGDYTLNYLYTDNALVDPVTTSSVLWPAVPADVVIPAGGTLVLWVVNPAGVEAGLTAEDFNANYGTDLELGVDLVQMYNGGMANGGSRGIQVMTNTGHDVSRAYYFDNDQTTDTTAIQYAWNPAAGEHMWTPSEPSGTVQTMLGLAGPTPGAVSADQIPASAAPTLEGGEAPVIRDLTESGEIPDSGGLDLGFEVSDDVLVRTVTLTLTDNLGATQTRNLAAGEDGLFTYSIPSADTFGKQWLEYSVTASDGVQESVLDPVRLDLVEGDPEPVRLSASDGEFVTGDHRVSATTEGDPASLDLSIDGTPATDTVPSLETGPVFALEATSTDAFFRNGIKLGDEVLTIFDEGFYDRIVTVDATVPVEQIVPGEPLTLTVTAGTKAWPEANVNENNDDFSARNLRLALPDGRILRPTSCEARKEADGTVTDPAAVDCPADDANIAFSDANLVEFLATFDIPEDAFDSIATMWDTTQVVDGPHTLGASDGTHSVSRTVTVDNSAPVVEPTVVEGELYRGDLTIDAVATDAGAGLNALTATLDGEPIELPFTTSSLELEPGEHTVEFTASDEVGNIGTTDVTFSTADERPEIALGGPEDGATIEAGTVDLTATGASAESDALDLSFREGFTFAPGDEELTVSAGTTTDALAASDAREGEVLSGADLEDLLGTDGLEVATESDTTLPYQLYTVDVPEDAGEGAQARFAWTGRANEEAKVLLHARTADGTWETIDEHLTTDGAATGFELGGTVPVDEYAVDGQVTFLVQHSEGFAAGNLSERTDAVDPFHAEATPRSEYDFTVAIESDTQYYNDNQGQVGGSGDDSYYDHQAAIHDFLLDQREELNLQYLIHNGDIVDNHVADESVWAPGNTDPEYQWKNADAQYTKLDEAGLPYGVLAGNHDVGGHDDDYTNYSKYFGEARFADNPWYGGSYKDNRGHYDLVSAGGVDFLMLYMGWPTTNDDELNSEDIAWMNEVIAQYPERKVWINLHEYMLTTGGLGPFPQRVFDEVVTPNENVFAVSSGHYHDAYTRTDDFDDDGDGAADRTVYSMLFDYQGLPEGGLGYLRLAHFDNAAEQFTVRTYSPSLEVFNSDDPSLNDPAGMQEFTVPYAAGGLESRTKVLATDSVRVDVLTAKEIGAAAGVPSGTEATVTWNDLTDGAHGWYVLASGPHGGEAASEVRTFTAVVPEEEPAPAEFVTSVPVVSGDKGIKPGSTLRVDPGTWEPSPEFSYEWLADGEPIAGATGETFKLTGKHKGQDITVRVTGALEGYETATVESEPVRWK